jgi:hypothetical protein
MALFPLERRQETGRLGEARAPDNTPWQQITDNLERRKPQSTINWQRKAVDKWQRKAMQEHDPQKRQGN